MSRRLGSGGFARVYHALDPELDMDVAIKMLRPELAADPETVERFRREASTAAKLRHPNVITVLTVGRLDEGFDGAGPGTPYLVMDYLPESLGDRVASGATLGGDELAKVGAEVARGLAFAHRQGIVHRDVKPENVLFARDGRAVVTDFGIARAVAGSATTNSRQVVLGTPTYFSPEQARGLPLDGRSDIYSLGVTLFRVATGQLPFPNGDTWYDVMRHHVETPAPRARSVVPGLAAALDVAIARCLAKRPDDRYATADELAIALDSARGQRPSGMATVAVPGPISGPRNRRPLALAAGAVVLAAGAALATAAVRNRGGDGPAQTAGRSALPPASAAPAAPADSTTAAPSATAAARDTADSTPPAPPRRTAAEALRLAASRAAPALAVTAPGSADLFVDGVRVGRGAWRRDEMSAGRHVVRAAVPSPPECTSADTSVLVDLTVGSRRLVRLEPVPCGRLGFDVAPSSARYRLVPAAGGPPREGLLPTAEPLVLPEGDYDLTIEAAQCAVYTSKAPVVAGATRVERARLICN